MTERQEQILKTYLETGDKSAAARKLGTSRENVRDTIKKLERRGEVPWSSPAEIPAHLKMTKTTIQVDSAGRVIQEWKRLSPVQELAEEFVEALCAKVKGKGKAPVRKARKTDRKDLVAEIDIYDSHIGMLCDGSELNGKDWDCSIAEKAIVETAQKILDRFDNPHRIIVTLGGDISHTNGRVPTTERSGNILDVDSRYSKVIQVIRRTFTKVIDLAAEKASIVDVVVLRGNHDPDGCEWLALVLDSYYNQCKNINVLLQRTDRKHIVFGKNLLVWTHGDGVPLKRWGEIIPNEFRKEWGETSFCHVKTGHIHHRRGKKSSVITQTDEGWVEQGGVLAESLPASCFKDSYHASKGFFGQMVGVAGFEYHKDYGLWSRFYQPMD